MSYLILLRYSRSVKGNFGKTRRRTGTTLSEDRLRQHGVNAFRVVNELCDTQVNGERAEGIGLVARHALFGDHKVDHLARGHAGCLVQVRMQAHRDEVGRRLSARPADWFALANGYLNRAAQRRFQGGDGDFTVTLESMAVAHRNQGAGNMDGKVQRGAGDEFFVVQIAGVPTGRAAREAADRRRGRDADRAPEWGQPEDHAGPEFRRSSPGIDGDAHEVSVG